MGCCFSRPTGPNSPYPGTLGTSPSARAINDSRQAGGTSAAPGANDELLPSPASPPARRRTRHHSQPLSQHINKPLRRHEWSSRNRVWTRAALDRERAEFFDTRVAGRQEIWQTIRAALEVLWTADMRAARTRIQEEQQAQEEDDEAEETEGAAENDPAVALATAQSILTAADITLPTGDVAQGAYDALGNYYAMPEYIVSDPTNVAAGGASSEDDMREDAKGDLTGEDTAEEVDVEDEDEDEAERRREEKGKAVVDLRDQVHLRARLSEGSQDVHISVDRGENVRRIARHIAEEANLPPNKKVRIAYMGKILKEGSPLPAQGWKQGHVVNALVFNR